MEHFSVRIATEQEQKDFSKFYTKAMWVVIDNANGSIYRSFDSEKHAQRICREVTRNHQERLNKQASMLSVQNKIIKILTDSGDAPIVTEGTNEYSGAWRRIELAEPVSGTKFSISANLMDSLYSSRSGIYRIATSRDRKAHTRTTKDGQVNAEKLLALVAAARSDCLSEHNRNIYNEKCYTVANTVRKTLDIDSLGNVKISGLTIDISTGSDDEARIKISGYVTAEKAAAIVDALRNLESATA